MKKAIIFFLCGVIIAQAFAESNIKLPRADKVNIKIINTVERNEENERKYEEIKYPRLSKNKILVNSINFYNTVGELLYSIDMMEVNKIDVNDESNVFLCLQYENKYQDNQIEYLYIFDFINGKQQKIAQNVYTYLLSRDGKKVYYISDFNYKTSSDINLTLWKNNKYKNTNINYKKYTKEEACTGFILKEEKDCLALYLYQEAIVLVKLFIDKNLKVIDYSQPKYDEEKGLLCLTNPDGSIEYFE